MPQRELVHPLQGWENSVGFAGFWRAWGPVCTSILLKPSEFFRKLTDVRHVDFKKRVSRAILFALLFGYLKLFADIANIFWIKRIPVEVLPTTAKLQISFLTTAVLGSPLFLLRPLFIFSATVILVAISVKLVLGFEKNLAPVLLIVCYKSVADVFYLIPVVGGILAAAWSVFLLTVGIKESYRAEALRSVFASVVMPFMMLIFFLLSIGPTAGRAILSFYPEVQPQVARVNDDTAFLYAREIARAAQTYKEDLGFYPANLDVLRKYLAPEIQDAVTKPSADAGYVYRYERVDDAHFTLEAKPARTGYSGRFVFYTDETAAVRLGDAAGPLIQDIKQLQSPQGS